MFHTPAYAPHFVPPVLFIRLLWPGLSGRLDANGLCFVRNHSACVIGGNLRLYDGTFPRCLGRWPPHTFPSAQNRPFGSSFLFYYRTHYWHRCFRGSEIIKGRGGFSPRRRPNRFGCLFSIISNRPNLGDPSLVHLHGGDFSANDGLCPRTRACKRREFQLPLPGECPRRDER